jgi:ankyrin repeat protein
VVWNYYLQNPGDAFFENFLTTIGLSHHDPDTLHKRKFSVVHQIVLGLSKVDLDEYLRTAGDEIDRPDLSGKTPLCWAASRPNPVFVRILLRHGASLHTSDRRKQTPLHYCAGSGHAYSMEIMLKIAKERMGGKHQPTNAFSDLINAKDSKGRTPLNFATRMNFSTHARLLIAAGADIESPDEPLRRTILLTAIYWNSHEVLSILLDSGAKIDQCDASHASVLHYAARYANLETLNVLLQHDLSNCDIDARDDGALTALETFESTQDRVEFETEENQTASAAAFARILARCKGGSSGHVIGIVEGGDEISESDVSEGNDDFHDANSVMAEDIEEN